MGERIASRKTQEGFRFGRFEVDVRSRELLKDGIRIRMQEQPLELLLALLERPAQLISRSELQSRLWRNGTFVDFEHSLNAAMKRLRAAINDDPERPRFIETLSRRGYRFISHVERIGPAPERTDLPHRAATRLAVVPFVDLSGGDGSYFAEGLSEELMTELGRVFAGRVGILARGSSALVAERVGRQASAIGHALAADYVVQGTIRRDGDRVRITARLVETDGETQLWAQTYERDLSDVFAVQTEVTSDIARSLAVELIPEGRPPQATRTRDVRAHQAFLTGRYHWNRPGPDGLREAANFFETAIHLDPQFAPAYSSLARTHIAIADYYLVEPREALEAARRAATQALELDPRDADAHAALAEVWRTVDWDWGVAEGGFARAIASNPSNTGAHRLYGLFLAARGRERDALEAVGRACELDPLCLVVNTSAAWTHYLFGHHEAAIERCAHTLDMDERFAPAYRVRGAALLCLGREAEAIESFERGWTIRADAVSAAWLAHACGRVGEAARMTELLASLRDTAATRYVSSYHAALGWLATNDFDAAFEWLSRAADERDPAIAYLIRDIRFDPIRGDARYQRLVSRLRLS
jgi:TolB-like protein/Tfp pilus assembly protein PilF